MFLYCAMTFHIPLIFHNRVFTLHVKRLFGALATYINNDYTDAMKSIKITSKPNTKN